MRSISDPLIGMSGTNAARFAGGGDHRRMAVLDNVWVWLETNESDSPFIDRIVGMTTLPATGYAALRAKKDLLKITPAPSKPSPRRSGRNNSHIGYPAMAVSCEPLLT